MIPLARWLESDGSFKASLSSLAPAAQLSSESMSAEDKTLETVATPDARDSYIAELESALRLARDEIESARAEAAENERRLLEKFGASAAQVLADGIERMTVSIKSGLEAALAEVLDPFIGEEIRRNAVTELCRLVESSLDGGHGLDIDLHAPADLHGLLGQELAARGIHARLHDAGEILLVSGSLRCGFEELSAAWLTSLKGDAA